MPTELFTLEYLASQAGMVAAVMLLVFFVKWLTGWEGTRVRVIAFCWAALIVLTVMVWQKALVLCWPVTAAFIMALILWLLNAMLITLLALGAYEIKKEVKNYYSTDEKPQITE